jgi:uncharacterized LabA/DUF88 family protein
VDWNIRAYQYIVYNNGNESPCLRESKWEGVKKQLNVSKNNFAFIDGNNVHLSMVSAGWALDYRRFRVYLKDKYDVTEAYYFIGMVVGNEKLYSNLESHGYNMVFKPTLRIPGKGYKGHCDAELVLEVMKRLNEFNKAVLVTSDGDFRCLVEYLLQIGKLERVLAPCRSGCSVLLRKAAGVKIDYFNNLREKLAYKGKEAPHEDETSQRAP